MNKLKVELINTDDKVILKINNEMKEVHKGKHTRYQVFSTKEQSDTNSNSIINLTVDNFFQNDFILAYTLNGSKKFLDDFIHNLKFEKSKDNKSFLFECNISEKYVIYLCP